MSKLFSSYKIRETKFKNRIVMSPMCMYAVEKEDGAANDFHLAHYMSRAAGGAGLIMLESTAVQPEGRISLNDLGLWNDEQTPALKRIVEGIHHHDAKAGIQLGHAGRKAVIPGKIVSASSLSYDDNSATPYELTREEIGEIVEDFKRAAYRASAAGFDVIEIHAAHGYLIHQFLSPITNHREDAYGGPAGNRYRFLREIILAVRKVWHGALMVRISATDGVSEGLQIDDYLSFVHWMKTDGADFIDVSTGGLLPVSPESYPGYQVPFAEEIRSKVGIATGAVGLITEAVQAEEILRNERADLIFIGRELLRNPYFPREAAIALGEKLAGPSQYRRAW